ncbi:hypothetical protein LUX05_12840 [Streptomyces somaliensis]|nr:hypothetical protein [Streptomyces somaliensis]
MGRTTATAVLARRLADEGRIVLVVDLDLESPGVGPLLLAGGTPCTHGVVDHLVESALGNADGLEIVARSGYAPATGASCGSPRRAERAPGASPTGTWTSSTACTPTPTAPASPTAWPPRSGPARRRWKRATAGARPTWYCSTAGPASTTWRPSPSPTCATTRCCSARTTTRPGRATGTCSRRGRRPGRPRRSGTGCAWWPRWSRTRCTTRRTPTSPPSAATPTRPSASSTTRWRRTRSPAPRRAPGTWTTTPRPTPPSRSCSNRAWSA